MPNPFTIADAADLVDISIQDIFAKSDPPGLDFYKQYYNVNTGVTDYYAKDSSLSTLDDAGRIVEGASVTASSPIQGLIMS